MKYFRIKGSADQKKRSDGSILIADELYTAKEAEAYGINRRDYDIVEVSPRKTYVCFGARFCTA